jgi:hypothetical protein
MIVSTYKYNQLKEVLPGISKHQELKHSPVIRMLVQKAGASIIYILNIPMKALKFTKYSLTNCANDS